MTEQEEPQTQASEPTKRYAVYDKNLLRFVGKVHDTKSKADDAAAEARKAAGKGRRFEVREV